jgi:hypothetical protein
VVIFIVPVLRVQVAMVDGALSAIPNPPHVAAIPTANPNAIQRPRFVLALVSMSVPLCSARRRPAACYRRPVGGKGARVDAVLDERDHEIVGP